MSPPPSGDPYVEFHRLVAQRESAHDKTAAGVFYCPIGCNVCSLAAPALIVTQKACFKADRLSATTG